MTICIRKPKQDGTFQQNRINNQLSIPLMKRRAKKILSCQERDFGMWQTLATTQEVSDSLISSRRPRRASLTIAARHLQNINLRQTPVIFN